MATFELLNKIYSPYNSGYSSVLKFLQFNLSIKDNNSGVYISQNKIIIDSSEIYNPNAYINVHLRLKGGKGGFGSLLRSMGSRMGRSSNTGSCRNLEGRRMRDVQNDQKIEEWLAKNPQKKEEESKDIKKLKRLTKIVNKGDSKHIISDPNITENYFKSIEAANESIADAITSGIQKTSISNVEDIKVGKSKKIQMKKNPKLMWGFEDLSDTDNISSDTDQIKDTNDILSTSAKIH
ncbi:hypothetical protein HZS_7799 [Henneguya salminicola]|nr:hypothetical protein HZS_7799 [Henneguya salminicola]